MLIMKKIQAIFETVGWLIVVVLLICIGLPIWAGLTLLGIAFRFVHIDIVAKIAAKFMDMILAFVKFVTFRIRKRTQEIEALMTR